MSISFMAFAGVSITLETYIRGARANLIKIVILTFIVRYLCFHMIGVVLKLFILSSKLCL